MLERKDGDASERALAVDISRSIVAQAPAGSGKTTLLLDRYLRLLATADEPEAILVVTFTRKAAAEVRSRIVAALAARDHPSVAAVLARDAARQWELATTPHRLRIETIDAFALSLARRVPIVAQLPANGRFVEDAAALYRIAVDRVFAHLDASPFAAELARVLELFDNDYARAADALVAMLARRDQWLDAARASLESTARGHRSELASSAIRALQAHVIADSRHALAADLEEIRAVASLVGVAENGDRDVRYYQRLGALFTTQDGRLRKRLDARQGFSPTLGREPKRRMLALLERLRARALDEVLFNLRLLPDDTGAVDASTEVAAVTLALSLAALELGHVFRSTGRVDFTELTFAARRALGSAEAPSELTLALDHRLQHVLIDEFQDTSVSQLDLLTRLLEGWDGNDGRTFFAVGDPMQSIYRFRDAEVALMVRSTRDGVGPLMPTAVRLARNFRSDPALVAWNNRVFASAFGAVDDPQLGRIAHAPSAPTRDSRPEAEVSVTLIDVDRNERFEAALVAAKIVELSSSFPGESIAVLVRSRTHLGALVPALDARGVRWQGLDIEDASSHPVIRDLLVLLDALQDPTDQLAWLSLLRSPLVGLGLGDLLVCSSGTHVRDLLSSRALIDRLSPDGARRIARVAPTLDEAFAWRGQAVPAIWLEETWRALGGAYAYPNDDTELRAAAVFEQIEMRGTRLLDGTELRLALSQRGDRITTDPNAVQLMTIHRAKGLEFDHVLIPGIDRETRRTEPPLLLFRPEGNGLLMATSRSSDARLYEWLWREERHREAHERTRALYVATTRARFSLHLYGCHERASGAPDGTSLLAPIWEAIASEVRWIADMPTPETGEPRAIGYRLPADIDIPRSTRSALHRTSRAVTRIGVARAENPVHRLLLQALHMLVHSGAPEDARGWVDARRPHWRRALELDTSVRDLQAAETFLAETVRAVLADERGRWLLAARPDARTCVTFAIVDGDEDVLVEMDLVFVDAAAQTWIVLFDTGDIGATAAERDRWLTRVARATGARAGVYDVTKRSWREAIA